MALSDFHITATDSELISLAQSPSSEILCYHDWLDHRIIKISPDAVIKWGPGVTREEADNQRIAHATLDPEIVRVPTMYRYMNENGIGYIVMECIYGETLTTSQAVAPGMLKRLAGILEHLSQQKGEIPGPFCGGRVCGLVWPDEAPISFVSKSDLQSWLGKRLARVGVVGQGAIEFEDLDLVLCHMDFAPRNLTVLKDGSLCLIDWALAGYYPRFFETVASRFVPEEEREFQQKLFEERVMLRLSPRERGLVGLVERVCRAREGEDERSTNGVVGQLMDARGIEQECLAGGYPVASYTALTYWCLILVSF